MRSSVRYLALVAMTALAACGDDDGVSPTVLSEAEATELASAVFSQSVFNAMAVDYQPPATAPGGPQLASYSATVETSGPCPMGGQAALTGAIDVETNDETGAGTLDYGLTVTHQSCVVQGDQGTQFTLNGNPNLVLEFTATTTGEGFGGFDGSLTGAVDFTTPDEQGTCQITYDFSGESSQSGFSFSTNGNVCGHSISQNVTVTQG